MVKLATLTPASLVPFTILALAAAYYGGNSEMAGMGLTALICALASLMLLRFPPSLHGLGLPLALAFIPLGWALVQALPLPSALSWLGHPIWAQTSTALGQPVTPHISVIPLDTLRTALAAFAYIAWAAVVFGLTRAFGLSPVLKGTAAAGLVICLYGLATYIGGNTVVLFTPKIYYLDSLSATFVNRNTFATFAGLTTLAAMAVFLERYGHFAAAHYRSSRQRIEALWKTVIQRRWPWLLAGFASFLSLILSNSRAGLACTLIGMGVMVLCLMRRRSLMGNVKLMLALQVACLVLVALFATQLGERLTTVGPDFIARASLYHTTLLAWLDNPLVGTGLGGFEETFRLYRTPQLPLSISMRIDHAHSTPLELLLELGLIGALPLAMLAVLVVKHLLQGLRNRKHRIIYPALGLGASTLTGLHALFDFSLETPAVALYTLTLLVLAWVGSQPHGEEAPEDAPTPRWVFATLPLLLAVAVVATVQAFGLWSVKTPLDELTRLRSNAVEKQQAPTAEQLTAVTALLLPHQSAPEVARELVALESLMPLKGMPKEKREALFHSIVRNAQVALVANPTDSFTWHRLSQTLFRLNRPDEAIAAFRQSLATGRWEPRLAWARTRFLMHYFNKLPPDLQADQHAMLPQLWNANPYHLWWMYRTDEKVLDFIALHIKDNPQAVKTYEFRTKRTLTPPAAPVSPTEPLPAI